MKFKSRYLIEREVEVEAASSLQALDIVGAGLNSTGMKYKVLGVLPVGEEWPDAEKPAPRPPRSTPPSGSPGTPVLKAA